jgi:hypothetical protein
MSKSVKRVMSALLESDAAETGAANRRARQDADAQLANIVNRPPPVDNISPNMWFTLADAGVVPMLKEIEDLITELAQPEQTDVLAFSPLYSMVQRAQSFLHASLPHWKELSAAQERIAVGFGEARVPKFSATITPAFEWWPLVPPWKAPLQLLLEYFQSVIDSLSKLRSARRVNDTVLCAHE